MILLSNLYSQVKTDNQFPVIFTGSANYGFKDAFTTIMNDFLSSYNGVGTFSATGQRPSRMHPINKLTMEEFMFLKVVCKYDNPVDVLDNTLNSYRIRVFIVKTEFPLGYSIQRFTYKSPVNDKDSHCISVFIGSNFVTDKSDDATRFLFDIIEAYVDLQLCDYGVQLNNIVSSFSNDKAIVMDYHVSSSDALFITRYFVCLFKTFIQAVDDLLFTKKFELLWKAERPYLIPVKKDIIESIYNYAHDELENSCTSGTDLESDFIDLCTRVYEDLLMRFEADLKTIAESKEE